MTSPMLLLWRFPNGDWKIEESGSDRRDIQFKDVHHLASQYDLIVPHMFCPQGMTSLPRLL